MCTYVPRGGPALCPATSCCPDVYNDGTAVGRHPVTPTVMSHSVAVSYIVRSFSTTFSAGSWQAAGASAGHRGGSSAGEGQSTWEKGGRWERVHFFLTAEAAAVRHVHALAEKMQ